MSLTPNSPGQAGHQRRRPSSGRRRVGFRIKSFEACSAFTHVSACMLAGSLRPFPSMAPTTLLPPSPLRLLPAGATPCRMGLAPTEHPRLARRTSPALLVIFPVPWRGFRARVPLALNHLAVQRKVSSSDGGVWIDKSCQAKGLESWQELEHGCRSDSRGGAGIAAVFG